MLKEAIEKLAELGTTASGIEVKPLCNRKVLVRQGSEHSLMTTDAGPRNYRCDNCDSFVELTAALGHEPIVFVDERAVTAVLDDDYRDDKVSMGIPYSRAFNALGEIGKPCDQRLVIAKLREELDGCTDSRFLAVIRRMDFQRSNDGRAHITHGRESLGKSVEAAVQSADGDIPEAIVMQFPAWAAIGFDSTVAVKCAVTVDPVNEKIAVRPVGEELQLELARVRAKLRDFLATKFAEKASGVIVVLGSPNI